MKIARSARAHNQALSTMLEKNKRSGKVRDSGPPR